MNKMSLIIAGLTAAVLINWFAASEAARAQQPPLSAQVLAIFEQRCAKCHGPEGLKTTTRPNADFDTIMDLPSLVANPDIIVPGNLNDSKLWTMVEDEMMPDSEQDEEPLPAKEKDIIRQWILAGSPVN